MHQVADGIDARQVRLHLLVDAHAATVVLEPLLHELLESARVGTPTYRHQHVLPAEALFPLWCAGYHLLKVALIGNGLHPGIRGNGDATLAERTHEEIAYLVIHWNKNVGQHFDNRDLRA